MRKLTLRHQFSLPQQATPDYAFCRNESYDVDEGIIFILLILCYGACFDVPTEWREEIKKICKVAENSVFPSDAQRLYGTNVMGTQV